MVALGLATPLLSSESLPPWLELAAMSLSSFFGAVVATNRKVPALGIVLGGIIVGLGGGIVRDMMLATMPVAVSQPSILPSVVVATLLGGLTARFLDKSRIAMLLVQALTVGLLVVIGAEKAIDFGVPSLSVILLALVTASAGGAMLDALTGQRAALLSQGRWHVSALVCGAVVFLLLYRVTPAGVAEFATVALIVLLRILSYQRSWSCPVLPGTVSE